MTRNVLITAIAAITLAASPAAAGKAGSDTAATDASPSAQPALDAKAKADPKICRTFENSASRMKAEKLCLTRAEWKKFEDQQ